MSYTQEDVNQVVDEFQRKVRWAREIGNSFWHTPDVRRRRNDILTAARERVVACLGHATDYRSGVRRWWDCSRVWACDLEDGYCQPCRGARDKRARMDGEAEAHRRARERKRDERLATASPCEACGGPLWPEGVPTGRVRSDKRACSPRCRQRLRRAAA